MKSHLETKAFKMARLATEKFPHGKVCDTVKDRVPDVDRGRCDSRNIFGVIMGVDLTKYLFKTGTKDGILNLLYTRNQSTTCTEVNVNISDVPSIKIIIAEIAKSSCRNNCCSCRKSNMLCNSKCHYSLSCKNRWHSSWNTPWCFYICFSFLTNGCNENYILFVFVQKKKFQLTIE